MLVNIGGYSWIFVDIYGYLWISMDMGEYRQFFGKTQSFFIVCMYCNKKIIVSTHIHGFALIHGYSNIHWTSITGLQSNQPVLHFVLRLQCAYNDLHILLLAMISLDSLVVDQAERKESHADEKHCCDFNIFHSFVIQLMARVLNEN